jgi:hypothetical protein
MGKTSAAHRLKRKLDTLDRRLDYLESKPHQNSWDRAEMAALELALDVIDRHQDTALELLREERRESVS